MRRALATRSSRNPQPISNAILVQLKNRKSILTTHVNLRVGAKRKSRHKRGRSETKILLSGPRAWRGKSCLKKIISKYNGRSAFHIFSP